MVGIGRPRRPRQQAAELGDPAASAAAFTHAASTRRTRRCRGGHEVAMADVARRASRTRVPLSPLTGVQPARASCPRSRSARRRRSTGPISTAASPVSVRDSHAAAAARRLRAVREPSANSRPPRRPRRGGTRPASRAAASARSAAPPRPSSRPRRRARRLMEHGRPRHGRADRVRRRTQRAGRAHADMRRSASRWRSPTTSASPARAWPRGRDTCGRQGRDRALRAHAARRAAARRPTSAGARTPRPARPSRCS